MENKTKEICVKCSKEFTGDDIYMICHVCNNKYHLSSCCSVSSASYKAMSKYLKLNWRCDNCKKHKTKAPSDNNDHQLRKQARSGDLTDDSDASISKRDCTNDVLSLALLRNDVAELKNDFRGFRKALQEERLSSIDLKSTLENLNETLDFFRNKIIELFDLNKSKDLKIEKLEEKINTLEQNSLQTNIEIKNAPTTDTAINVVKSIATKLNVSINENDIVDAYREKRSNKIIVKFSSTKSKKELMENIKKTKLKTGDIVSNESYAAVAGESNRIYINDELTKFYRNLLWIAKNKAKEKNWRFVWVKYGKILAKKDENSKYISILKESDISLII